MSTEENMTYLDGIEAAVSDLYHDQLVSEGSLYRAKDEATKLWLSMLPKLTSRVEAQLFIAAVARGYALRWLDRETVKQCMYMAQLALAAYSNPIRQGGAR